MILVYLAHIKKRSRAVNPLKDPLSEYVLLLDLNSGRDTLSCFCFWNTLIGFWDYSAPLRTHEISALATFFSVCLFFYPQPFAFCLFTQRELDQPTIRKYLRTKV